MIWIVGSPGKGIRNLWHWSFLVDVEVAVAIIY